jgi:hypothetical protein
LPGALAARLHENLQRWVHGELLESGLCGKKHAASLSFGQTGSRLI